MTEKNETLISRVDRELYDLSNLFKKNKLWAVFISIIIVGIFMISVIPVIPEIKEFIRYYKEQSGYKAERPEKESATSSTIEENNVSSNSNKTNSYFKEHSMDKIPHAYIKQAKNIKKEYSHSIPISALTCFKTIDDPLDCPL